MRQWMKVDRIGCCWGFWMCIHGFNTTIDEQSLWFTHHSSHIIHHTPFITIFTILQYLFNHYSLEYKACIYETVAQIYIKFIRRKYPKFTEMIRKFGFGTSHTFFLHIASRPSPKVSCGVDIERNDFDRIETASSTDCNSERFEQLRERVFDSHMFEGSECREIEAKEAGVRSSLLQTFQHSASDVDGDFVEFRRRRIVDSSDSFHYDSSNRIVGIIFIVDARERPNGC